MDVTSKAAENKAAVLPPTDAPDSSPFARFASMTSWYDPRQLIETAKKTLISTTIGENADPRLVGELPKDGVYFDYSQSFPGDDFAPDTEIARRDIWIDYVSDVGDGFHSTYSVAYALAGETLDVSGRDLPRGEILIFGGDSVYPSATSAEYEKKLVKPYRLAFNAHRRSEDAAPPLTDLKKSPHVFALPGNHDWYDSLVAFQKIFCTSVYNDRLFAGGWQTRQTRSYFALRLPQKWWLLGIDLQLSHNIDVPQLRYFQSIAAVMEKGDRVILAVPEPYWVKAIKYQDFDEAFEKLAEKEESIKKLEDLLAKKGVHTRLYVAGDLHHYRRFEAHAGGNIQKITAGGGGAFLHPTHDFDYAKKRRRRRGAGDKRLFDLKKNYPETSVSRRLGWRNLFGFIWRNPTFGVLTAALYPLLALLINGRFEANEPFSFWEALKRTIDRLLSEPLALIVMVLLVIALVFFTDSNDKWYRRIAGTIHGLTHLAAVFLLGWLAFFVSQKIVAFYAFGDATAEKAVWFLCILAICGVGGYLAGSFIMGLYLFVSLQIFGRHDNEAFSALRIEDYKNFLRLHIDENGDLTVYPIKIERINRHWIYEPNEGGGFYRPQSEIKTELIEKPIVIKAETEIKNNG